MFIKKMRISFITLFACLYLCGAVTYAFDLDISNVSYYNDDGAISRLTPNETVYVKLSVENQGDDVQSAIFAAQLMKDGERIDFEFEQYTILSGEAKEFTAALVMPSDISNCSIEVNLWDNLWNMKPLCNSGTFPSGNTAVKTFKVNGESVAFDELGKSKEAVKISTNKRYPEIFVEFFDNSTSAEIINPTYFPGKAVVKAKAANGDRKEFIVNYKIDNDKPINDKPIIENLVYKGPSEATAGVPYTDNSVIIPAFKIKTDLQAGSPIVQGYDAQITKLDLPEGYEMEGMPYISPSWIYYGETPGYDNVLSAWKSRNTLTPWYNVDLNFSADICVLKHHTVPYFVTLDDGWKVWDAKGNGSHTSENAYARLNNRYGNPWISVSRFYTKRVHVNEGETLTVTLYNGSNAANTELPYIVFFMPIYEVD